MIFRIFLVVVLLVSILDKVFGNSCTVAVPPTGHSHQRVTWAPEANNFMMGLAALDLESSTCNRLGVQFITGMAKY